MLTNKKMVMYVRSEDKGRMPDNDIIEFKPVDINYGHVPLNKESSNNLEKTSECNLKRFNLEPKDKTSDY